MESYLSRWSDDTEFVELFNKFNNLYELNNQIDTAFIARLYILRQLAAQQSSKNLNFAECGVYAGMSMLFTADKCNKRFIGVDSFEGVSDKTEFDTDYFDTVKLDIDMKYALLTLDGISNVEIYKGWIPEALNNLDELEYSYVHIDVDMYEPTRDSISYFWPRLCDGGVMICDDYGSHKTTGARKAMNDFFKRSSIIELPTGQAIVFKGITSGE
jgi:hypothetical protein